MAEHTRNADRVYDDFYSATNLADLIVDFDGGPIQDASEICNQFVSANACETSLRLDGSFDKENEDAIPAIWHGYSTYEVSTLYFEEGEMADAMNEIVIDRHAADELDIAIGDEVNISSGTGWSKFNVVGIANHPEHLWFTPDSVMMPQEGNFIVGYMTSQALAELSNLSLDSRNRISIDLPGTPSFDLQDTTEDEGAEISTYKAELSQILTAGNHSDARISDRGLMQSVELLRMDLEGTRKSLPIMGLVLTVVSGLVIAVSLDRLVKSQSREIAVMRTLGIESKDIMFGYLLAPLIIGGAGSIAGILLGISPIGSSAMTNFYFEFMGVPVVITHHYPDLIAMIGILTTIGVFLFGIRPAIKAAKMMPLEVMSQQSEVKGRRWLNRITKGLPVSIALGIRSTFRRPGRLALTLIALSLSMVILGGTMLMMSSFEQIFQQTMYESENWDKEVIASEENLPGVESWAQQNAEAHEKFMTFTASLIDQERTFAVSGLEVISEFDDAMHSQILIEGKLPAKGANPPQVLIDEGMSEILGWKVGEEVEFELFGTQKVQVSGVNRELSRVMTFNFDDLKSLSGMNATGIRLELADEKQVDDELEAISIMIMDSKDRQQGFEQMMEQQDAAMMTFYVIGVAIAVSILFNTLMMNLAERDTELATLRVFGASRWSLAWILTVEHLLIGLIGGIAGMLSSVIMAEVLVSTFSTWSFHLPLVIDWFVSLQIIAFVFVIALLTTPVGMWRISRMNLIEVVSRHER